MSNRLISLAVLLALVVAACGGTTEASTTTSDADPTSTTSPAVEAVLLSYTLADGDELSYDVALDQHIDITASGDASLMGDEEIPGQASVDIAGTATFTHSVTEGSEPGTYDVHIVGEFADVTVEGVVDGEPIDSSEVPDFAALDPVDVTVTVDEQGRPVTSDDPDDIAGALFGGLGAMGADTTAPGLDIGQFVGPMFSDEEVTVGDTWSEEIETPGIGDPIVTSVTSTVTGVDEVDGVEVFVIDTSATTSLIEFDLAQFFAGLFGGFMPEDASEEEKAEMEAMLEEFRFLMTVDGARADTTTHFDAEAGVARRAVTESGSTISMDMNVPNEENGEMESFVMEMRADQTIEFQLVSATKA